MVWGKSSDREAHRERSQALTAAYADPHSAERERERERGSKGGAPIWVMREGFMSQCTCKFDGRAQCPTHSQLDFPEDPEGYAVFGRYPKDWLPHVLKLQLLGDVRRDEILHVCSGTLMERWTVDIRRQARPAIQASGTALPFKDSTFPAIMLDPPYGDDYAKNLYRTDNPRNSWLLKEAARVVQPGGRIGLLHVAIPFSPPQCKLVKVWPMSTGVGFRIRAFTIWQKQQASLPLDSLSPLAGG